MDMGHIKRGFMDMGHIKRGLMDMGHTKRGVMDVGSVKAHINYSPLDAVHINSRSKSHPSGTSKWELLVGHINSSLDHGINSSDLINMGHINSGLMNVVHTEKI